jgi:ubiquinone/menaquinone biosynthesis C-methylase UbiE
VSANTKTSAGRRPMSNFWQNCRDVDHTAAATEMAEHLDEIGALAPVQAAKRESLALLELSAGDHVLDVGCGTGNELMALAEIVGTHGRVVGLDNSSALIAAAERRTQSSPATIELVVGDAHTLGFADGAFHAARADRTLQHLAKPDAALAEMVRVVRRGGRVVITEGQWGLEARNLDPALTKLVSNQLFGEGDRREWVGHLLPVMLRMAGLVGLRLFSYSAVIHDAASLHRLLKLRWAVMRLADQGEISPADGAAWLGSLGVALDRGDACGRLALFHLVGVRPS